MCCVCVAGKGEGDERKESVRTMRARVCLSSGLGPGAAVRQFGLIDSWDNVIIDNCVSCETDLLLPLRL